MIKLTDVGIFELFKADYNIYKELITIDEKLGTKMTEQLFYCVAYSFRKDLFQV